MYDIAKKYYKLYQGGCMIIGICDDDKTVRTKIQNICEKIFLKFSEEIEILQFADGLEIANKIVDILILDIDMPNVSGIEVKERIQDEGLDTVIIFVTNHDEFVLQAFGKNVIGFVNKSNMDNQLEAFLKSAIKIKNKNIIIEGINSKDILFIKSEQVYCNVYISNNEQCCLIRSSIKELEKVLNGTALVKVHKSYIVNFEYVDAISNGEFVIGEKRIPISTRLRTKVIAKYKDYCRENARYC